MSKVSDIKGTVVMGEDDESDDSVDDTAASPAPPLVATSDPPSPAATDATPSDSASLAVERSDVVAAPAPEPPHDVPSTALTEQQRLQQQSESLLAQLAALVAPRPLFSLSLAVKRQTDAAAARGPGATAPTAGPHGDAAVDLPPAPRMPPTHERRLATTTAAADTDAHADPHALPRARPIQHKPLRKHYDAIRKVTHHVTGKVVESTANLADELREAAERKHVALAAIAQQADDTTTTANLLAAQLQLLCHHPSQLYRSLRTAATT